MAGPTRANTESERGVSKISIPVEGGLYDSEGSCQLGEGTVAG